MAKMTAMQLAKHFGIPYWQVSEALYGLRNGSRRKNYKYDYEQAKYKLIQNYARKNDAAMESVAHYSGIIRRIESAKDIETEE